jgi:exodeoxyribonuclease VII large subunit
MSIFTIKELSELIKDNIPRDKINLLAEVREPKIRNGHMYLTLKDDNGYISSIVWKSNITEEIKNLKEGDKINIIGNLSFYQNRCSLNFVINKLISVEGKGQLMIEYENLFKKYTDKGYFLDSKKIIPSKVIKKILILTSKDGAALQDFYYGLENGNCNISHELINVIVQGNDCPKNIIGHLNILMKQNLDYDMIIITRGGGSFEDLFGFCKEELIECVHKFREKINIPILSAIGHQVDTVLLDYIADIVAPTPSLASQFIVDNNKKYIDELYYLRDSMLNIIKENVNYNLNNIINISSRIEYYYRDIKNTFYDKIKEDINENLNIIDRYENKYSNEKIIISSNNKILKDENDILHVFDNKTPLDFFINGKKYTVYDYKLNLKAE